MAVVSNNIFLTFDTTASYGSRSADKLCDLSYVRKKSPAASSMQSINRCNDGTFARFRRKCVNIILNTTDEGLNVLAQQFCK